MAWQPWMVHPPPGFEKHLTTWQAVMGTARYSATRMRLQILSQPAWWGYNCWVHWHEELQTQPHPLELNFSYYRMNFTLCLLLPFFNKQTCNSSSGSYLGLVNTQKEEKPDPYCSWEFAGTLSWKHYLHMQEYSAHSSQVACNACSWHWPATS